MLTLRPTIPLFLMLSLVLFTLMLSIPRAQAAPVLDVVSGQLQGAFMLDIDGTSFDVEFVDGTCIGVFDGCDDTDDFAIQTRDTARLAAEALFSFVFLDGPTLGAFDSDPTLTLGCAAATTSCSVIVPFGVSLRDPTRRDAIFVINRDPIFGGDFTNVTNALLPATDTTALTAVYAKFTESNPAPVPVPSSVSLFATGLLGLAGFRWAYRRRG